MQIERHDGTQETRYYDSVGKMMEDAEKEAQNPQTKKLTLHFPKRTIPGRRKAGRKIEPVMKREEYIKPNGCIDDGLWDDK